MAVINSLVALIILLCLFAVISYAKVKLIIHGKTRVEITFTLFKLELYNFGSKKEGEKGSPLSFYRLLFGRLISLFRKSEVRLERLRVPVGRREDFATSAFTAPYGFHIAISTIIAYLRENSIKLIIDSNAVILSPDTEEHFSLTLSARTRLFYVLRTVLGIMSDQKSTKEKEVVRNVGE